MLRIDSLDHDYAGTPTLFNVSLEVREGEVVGLFGSNGAGKTTLLKLVSGLERPASGTVSFDGRDITRLPSHEIVQMGIAHSPEGRRLFGDLTVLENLDLGAASAEARSAKDESLNQVFELFPVLSDRRKQRAGSMSGGEQQMCAIGRALMARPRLLMLDEPSLGLAPLITSSVFDSLHVIRESGVTILLVEQNVAKALQLVDRGYVLERGKIVMQGTAEQLVSDPKLREAYLGI